MSEFACLCNKYIYQIPLSDFVCNKFDSTDKYELIQWYKGTLIFELYWEKYEFSISLFMYNNRNQIDIKKLLKLYSIPYLVRYEYSNPNNIKKAIEYYSEILVFLISEINTPLFQRRLLECKLASTTPAMYDLQGADNLYLSGRFSEAKEWYEYYETELNEIQRKRLKKIRKMEEKN